MEKERLLEDDQDVVPGLSRKEREPFYSHLPNPLSNLCALLLLLSLCCNCTLLWWLARQQHTSGHISEYGPSMNISQ